MPATTITTKVHFMSSRFVGRAACGRLVISYHDAWVEPQWTSDRAEVTCRACQRAMS